MENSLFFLKIYINASYKFKNALINYMEKKYLINNFLSLAKVYYI